MAKKEENENTHAQATSMQMEYLLAVLCGIQMDYDVLISQCGRNRVAFQIDADHAMSIHFALQVQPIKRDEPTIRVHSGWQCW
jgi:hypothetical protein